MNGLTAEVGYVSLIKKGEELCGDRVETVRQVEKSFQQGP